MTERLEDVWASRDYPVLVEVTRRIDAGEMPSVDQVRDALAIDNETMKLATKALVRRQLVHGFGSAEASIIQFSDVSAEAYFLTGLHPSGDDALSRLVDTLRQAADQTPDPEEKSRLRKAADAMLNISRDVAVGVMTAYISQQIPQ